MDIGYRLRRFWCPLKNSGFFGSRSFSPFLTDIKCWHSFFRENFTIVRSDFMNWWHAFILSYAMSEQTLLKILQTVCSKSVDLDVFDILIVFTHSRCKYLAFTQHCFSVFASCFRVIIYDFYNLNVRFKSFKIYSDFWFLSPMSL